MRRLVQCAILFLLVTIACPASSTAAIAMLDLDGPIDPITSDFVVKSIQRAERDRAGLLLIVLNTPGGFASSMEEMVAQILGSKVPIVIFVAPSGAKAASAGFFILLAADVAAMAPGTNTGAAHPLMAIGGFPVDGGEAGKTLTEKATSNARAFLRSIAAKRHRNVEEAEKGVVESKSFTDTEALEKKLIDLVARDESDLLEQLEGYRTRTFSGREVILRTAGQEVVEYPMTVRQKVLATISQPNVSLLLGLAGLLLLYFEFSNPGAIAPGVIGGICLLLSILGFSLLPVNFVGVLLIMLAIGLFIAEVKIQGFGILGIGGVVAMVIGLLILIDTPDPAVRIGLATALSVSLPFAVIFIILLIAVLKSSRQQTVTGEAGMIGLTGVADSEVYKAGRVRVRGEYWTARSAAPIDAGRPVRVLGIDDLTLEVEEIRD
jgi:membrane-bound serine protease (ClpP class)